MELVFIYNYGVLTKSLKEEEENNIIFLNLDLSKNLSVKVNVLTVVALLDTQIKNFKKYWNSDFRNR